MTADAIRCTRQCYPGHYHYDCPAHGLTASARQALPPGVEIKINPNDDEWQGANPKSPWKRKVDSFFTVYFRDSNMAPARVERPKVAFEGQAAVFYAPHSFMGSEKREEIIALPMDCIARIEETRTRYLIPRTEE